MNDLATPAIAPRLDLEDEIRRLKRERNAVLLAHYYQESEIQDVADFLGDSLQLAQAAKKTKADVIFFAGVHFMAETAKILNPDRIVVVPDLEAGCSLADGCPADRFRAWRARHPGRGRRSRYINCSAEVKAESDYICTSSNAEKIVRAIPEGQEILFAPDKNLGRWLVEKTRPHDAALAGELHRPRDLQPAEAHRAQGAPPRRQAHRAPRVRGAHPRASPTSSARPRRSSSTPIADDARSYIVATESGILHQMHKASPDKEFIAAPPEGNCACNECPYMRLNTLEKVYLALRDLAPRIEMDAALRERARVPIDRMLALS